MEGGCCICFVDSTPYGNLVVRLSEARMQCEDLSPFFTFPLMR